MKVVTPDEMSFIDKMTQERYLFPELLLMENAGIKCFNLIKKFIKDYKRPSITVVCGTGNNGGDGFVVARNLFNQGTLFKVFLVGSSSKLSKACYVNYQICKQIGASISQLHGRGQLDEFRWTIESSDILIDAIFGTGLTRDVSGIYKDIIQMINDSGKVVFSIDVPSGLSALDGSVLGLAVKATYTITIGLPKLGFYLKDGPRFTGTIIVEDIGFPRPLLQDSNIKTNILTTDEISLLFPKREYDFHKGSCGRVFLLCGSRGMTGAAYLTAEGALKIGAGLVYLGVPYSLNPILESKLTEVITKPFPETQTGSFSLSGVKDILEASSGCDCLVIGPGLGSSSETGKLVERLLLSAKCSVVLDADGLNLISRNLDVLKSTKVPLVLTPHPGEAGRILGLSAADIQEDRVSYCRRIAREFDSVCVLKGAYTLIGNKEGEVFINPTGNPGMASGGCGDVLTGMIGGLIAQGINVIDAAKVGVFLHGLSADEAMKERGGFCLVASDLLTYLPLAIKKVQGVRKRVEV